MERRSYEVIVIGGGFAGIAMSKRLLDEGITDFTVLERAGDVGGTWHYNTYPGCMCDVPSHLYSLSFAPNPEWSHTYSPQAEIRAYLRDCADNFGVRPHLQTETELQSAKWLEDEQLWEIETNRGTYGARVLVSAMGPLTEPKLPDLPGLESFAGKTMHSARWDHDYALAGKRVASIGTGASAIQYVPAIRSEAGRVDVYQRTAPWVMPHGDRPIRDFERSLYRALPLAQRMVRAGVYSTRELLVFGFAKEPRLMGLLEKLARSHIEKQISDPGLRERVTPDYTLGCKRMLPSNRWYRALGEPDVDLVTAGIAEVRETSIVDHDGIERETDAIIFGTGFRVTDMPAADWITGRGGELMRDVWRGSPRAYLGTAVPGFPNLFMLLGPNTGLGHSSMVYMIESQVEQVMGALAAMREADATAVEVRTEATDEYNREIDERLRGTVWDTGGCSSFYLDDTGRNGTLWPDFTFRFRRRAARFDRSAYLMTAREAASVAVPA